MNQAILYTGAIATVAQMVAAHRKPKFRPRGAACALWIGSYISQTGDQQQLVAASRHVAELLLSVGKDLDYIFLGGQREPITRQRLSTFGLSPLHSAPAQAFDELLKALVRNVSVNVEPTTRWQNTKPFGSLARPGKGGACPSTAITVPPCLCLRRTGSV
jgi:hypothetical protein